MTHASVVRELTKDSLAWPTGLCELSNPPARLHMLGDLPSTTRAVAIVGTRRPCAYARKFSFELARALGLEGFTIVSGGALGIDSDAHRGALAAGAPTIAILGTPVTRPYPPNNQQLFSEIAEKGAVLSELSATTPVREFSFLQRNRLIAAMAQVVVVVQAPVKSGALSTAAAARELGRPLLAVPHGPWEWRGAGCLGLLAAGAKICRSATDVLSLAAPSAASVPPRSAGKPKKRKRNQVLDPDEQALLGALRNGPATVDDLCELTGLAPSRVQRASLMLMLSRLIQEVGGGRYATLARP